MTVHAATIRIPFTRPVRQALRRAGVRLFRAPLPSEAPVEIRVGLLADSPAGAVATIIEALADLAHPEFVVRPWVLEGELWNHALPEHDDVPDEWRLAAALRQVALTCA